MRKTFLVAAAAAFLLFSGTLSAATYRLFVHGRSGDNHCSSNWSSDVNNYWGGTVSGLSNVRYVGFDGTRSGGAYSWSTCGAQRQVYYALNAHCKGSNRCEIYTHSTGGLVVARFLRYYSPSTYGWNISRVQLLANASGGSELADLSTSYLGWLGFDTLGGELDSSVSTSGARSWDHNSSNGHTLYTTSGEGTDYFYATSPFLPGKDDGVLANHSLCNINAVKDVDTGCTRGNGRLRESYTCWSGWNPFATCYRYYYRWSPYYTVYKGGGSHSHSDAKRDYNRR
jgi:hypothetical protein